MENVGVRTASLLLMLATATGPIAVHQPSRGLLDLDGRGIDPFDDPAAGAVVFVFVETDCPISNRYAPELARLHARFETAGVRFWLIHPGGGTSPNAIRQHLRAYGYPFGALQDPEFTLVDATGATVMPEAAVFDRERRLRYRGRIDDRYVSLGRVRPAPTRRDLEEALAALIAGRAIPAARTTAVGCLIADLR
jgi:hypothetical protein